MNGDYLTIREWLKKYENGDFTPTEDNTLKEMCQKAENAGWDEWYCCTRALLYARTKRIAELFNKITNDDVLDHYYIYLKNYYLNNNFLCDTIFFDSDEDLEQESFYIDIKNNVKECIWDIVVQTILDKDECLINVSEKKILSTNQEEDVIHWLNEEAVIL